MPLLLRRCRCCGGGAMRGGHCRYAAARCWRGATRRAAPPAPLPALLSAGGHPAAVFPQWHQPITLSRLLIVEASRRPSVRAHELTRSVSDHRTFL